MSEGSNKINFAVLNLIAECWKLSLVVVLVLVVVLGFS